MIYNYSKGDAILLDGAAQLINLSYFKSHEFVKVFGHNCKFDAKITICCLSDVRI